MSTYTYDETQISMADKVKFHTNQTGTTSSTRDYSDEEIQAVVARNEFHGRAREFYSAAELVGAVIIRHNMAGEGINKKEVDDLKITYAGRSEKPETLIKMRDLLLKEAARFSRRKPRSMRFINVTGYNR